MLNTVYEVDEFTQNNLLVRWHYDSNPVMRTKVIAKSDKGVFVGTEADGGFCVFSLDDSVDIDVGDVLRGVFDDTNGLFKNVRNETQDETVHICAENWECTKEGAFELLKKIGKPTKIWVL